MPVRFEKRDQFLIEADRRFIVSGLQVVGRLEQQVKFVCLESLVGMVGDQVQFA